MKRNKKIAGLLTVFVGAVYGCPFTIKNDKKNDWLIVGENKAVLIAPGKSQIIDPKHNGDAQHRLHIFQRTDNGNFKRTLTLMQKLCLVNKADGNITTSYIENLIGHPTDFLEAEVYKAHE